MARKDHWDKLEIVGAIVLPVMIGVLSYVIAGSKELREDLRFYDEHKRLELEIRNRQVENYLKHFPESYDDDKVKKSLFEYSSSPDGNAFDTKEFLNLVLSASNKNDPDKKIQDIPVFSAVREGERLYSRDKKIFVRVVDVSGQGATAQIQISKNIENVKPVTKDITKDNLFKIYKFENYNVVVEKLYGNETKMLDLLIRKSSN